MTYGWLDQIDAERFVSRAVISLLALSAGILCAVFFSRMIIVPLRLSLGEIRRGADLFSRGELSRRLSVPEPKEFYDLAHTLNRVGVEMKSRISVVERQRNELNAILSSMREGVMVLDSGNRIVRLNEAAERLLGVSRRNALGKLIFELVRNVSLQRLLDQAIAERRDIEGEVTLFDPAERSVQVYARIISDGVSLDGILVVLNDLTHLHRLENVRREFVANVSHELRTPITSVKGFVETLLDGAIDNPKEARRFLEIIGRQVDRLSSIFDDLLSLSRIEQQEGSGELNFERVAVRDLVEAMLQAFEKRAREKEISFVLELTNHHCMINRNLMEQALGNLVDNALKLSPEGAAIIIKSEVVGGDILFSIADSGPGIEAEHLARVFERFYRVDKGRSRQQGGTGLGLSIVKHIAQVHGGSVDVKSQVGQGTTFFVRIPSEQRLMRAL